MIKEINHLLGQIACLVSRSHREPHEEVTVYPFKVEFCNRCGHIFKKEKIGRTFIEIYQDVYNNSGNQIW